VILSWDERAFAQVVEAVEYIALSNQTAADQLRHALDRTIEQLLRFPLSGREGRVPGTRELRVGRTPFLVVYRVEGERIRVLRFVHGAREYPPGD